LKLKQYPLFSAL